MARAHRRRLRAALVFHGQVIADATLAPGAGLRVGSSGAHTLAVRPVGLCEGFEVLRSAARGERGVLRLTTAVEGWVCLGGRERSVADLVWCDDTPLRVAEAPIEVLPGDEEELEAAERGVAQPLREATVLEASVAPGDWGVLVLGESELVFQWVACSEAPWRLGGVGGLAWWAVPARRPVFGLAVLVSLLAQGALLFAAFWPLPARSEATVTVTREQRWVEYQAGRVEEAVERPAVGRLRLAARRMLQQVTAAQPQVGGEIESVAEPL